MERERERKRERMGKDEGQGQDQDQAWLNAKVQMSKAHGRKSLDPIRNISTPSTYVNSYSGEEVKDELLTLLTHLLIYLPTYLLPWSGSGGMENYLIGVK